MKKNMKYMSFFLTLLFLIGCNSNSFYGVYRNNNFETWNFYKTNEISYLSCYTCRIHKDETYEVAIEKENDKNYFLFLTNNTGKMKFILESVSNKWYLTEEYPNGKIREKNEFFKTSDNIKAENIEKLKNESEKFSDLAIFYDGYYRSKNNQIYHLYPEYPEIIIDEFILDNGILTDKKSGKIFLQGNEILFDLKGESVKFEDFRKTNKSWGYSVKTMYNVNDKIIDAEYLFNRIEIIKSFGLEENYQKTLLRSKILISKIGNLVIDTNDNEVIDYMPRFGGGCQGDDGISILTEQKDGIYPDDICLNIYSNYSDIDFEKGNSKLLRNYNINLYYKINKN